MLIQKFNILLYRKRKAADDHLPDQVEISQARLDRHKNDALTLDPNMLKSSFHRVSTVLYF